jgi:hypothetical protein
MLGFLAAIAGPTAHTSSKIAANANVFHLLMEFLCV